VQRRIIAKRGSGIAEKVYKYNNSNSYVDYGRSLEESGGPGTETEAEMGRMGVSLMVGLAFFLCAKASKPG
jgi:hypothetical protein